MAVIQVNSNINISMKDILKGVSNLETTELEYFLTEVSQILAQRKTNYLSERETDLLQKIHYNIPLNIRKRHKRLSKRLDIETITEEEYKELKMIIHVIEKKDVERLHAMIELAKIRCVSLDELMEDLELN